MFPFSDVKTHMFPIQIVDHGHLCGYAINILESFEKRNHDDLECIKKRPELSYFVWLWIFIRCEKISVLDVYIMIFNICIIWTAMVSDISKFLSASVRNLRRIFIVLVQYVRVSERRYGIFPGRSACCAYDQSMQLSLCSTCPLCHVFHACHMQIP